MRQEIAPAFPAYTPSMEINDLFCGFMPRIVWLLLLLKSATSRILGMYPIKKPF